MKRALVVVVCLSIIIMGCHQPVIEETQEQDENQVAGTLGQLFQERVTLATYRNIVEQLNTIYDHQGDPSKKALTLSQGQDAVMRQLLVEVKSDFDRARRIDEVKNRLFSTLADASYLDSCLLFRDAFASLQGDMGESPPRSDAKAVQQYQLDLVKYVHGWVMRQVALRASPAAVKQWPAHEILRLGAGDSEDRLRVFLGVMSQSDFDCCALVVKNQVRRDNIVENRQSPVLAGVLIEKQLYLFDPFTGLPVPGKTAGSVATFEELKQTPTLMAKRPDGPTPTQLAEGELVTLTAINGLAPRMEQLEKDFDGIKVKIKLADNVVARLDRFKAAGLVVKPWAAPNQSGFPGLVFAKYVEVGRNDPRLVDVVLPRAKLIPRWALEMEKQVGITGTPRSLIYEFDRLFLALRLDSGGGRDLLVRGKPHQAVAKMSQFENRIDKALDLFHKEMSVSIPQFKEMFLDQLVKANIELTNIQQKISTLASGSPEEQQLVARRTQIFLMLEGAWKEQSIKAMVSNLGAEWATPELREHLSYFMGLAKMELAIQAEMRLQRNPNAKLEPGAPTPMELYDSALEWFDRYEALIIPLHSNLWLDTVLARSQECRSRQAALRNQAVKTVQR